MTKKINVLVFPAEGQNAYELHDALSTCVNIHLIGGTSVARHGEFLFENYINNIPFITDKNFLQEFNEILRVNEIDVIFPTHDTIVKYLIENEEKINARIVSGDKETADICRDKSLTFERFKETDILPKRYYNAEEISFPAFVKPREGQGAVGARKITDSHDVAKIDFLNNIVTEYLPGEECTVDCLTDQHGILRYVSPRSRDRILAGMSVRGSNIALTTNIQHIADTLNSKLNFRGLWYFQIKKNKDGVFKLLEVSTRCAGTMCQTRAKGINLPLLSVYIIMGYDVDIYDNAYHLIMDRALIGRYRLDIDYNYVYIDFDDTITLRGKVNLNTIRFMYQCYNKGKKLILLTRHENDLEETLNHYAISKQLFYKIVHLNHLNESKSQYIHHLDSIFIDNAFKEREEVRQVHHIPVFDVDQIEFLLDWRI